MANNGNAVIANNCPNGTTLQEINSAQDTVTPLVDSSSLLSQTQQVKSSQNCDSSLVDSSQAVSTSLDNSLSSSHVDSPSIDNSHVDLSNLNNHNIPNSYASNPLDPTKDQVNETNSLIVEETISESTSESNEMKSQTNELPAETNVLQSQANNLQSQSKELKPSDPTELTEANLKTNSKKVKNKDTTKTKGKSPTPPKEDNSEAPSTQTNTNNGPPVTGKLHKPIRGKREDKEQRKEMRFLEELQKKLAQSSSNDDQKMLVAVIKKYQGMYDELKKNEATISDWQASYTLIRRERDSVNSENQRLLMRVGKTEALCRLQQQQNKQIKDEYISKLREEQDKRKEVTCKLHETLKQLDVVLNENSLRSTKLHEENIDMSQKLARLHQQVTKRNEETRSAEKQLELQKQLYTTEISKNRLEHEAEKEVYFRQVELLQFQLQEKETEIKIQKNELATMESRVDEYIKKYADIEPFISQSSKLFETYKNKIEAMNATNSSLETEVFDWQRKYNDCMRNVVDLTLAVKLKEKDLGHLERKLDRLQNLCRQLQTDRSNFLKQLKAAGLEPGQEAPLVEPVKEKEQNIEVLNKQSENLNVNEDKINKNMGEVEKNKNQVEGKTNEETGKEDQKTPLENESKDGKAQETDTSCDKIENIGSAVAP